MSDTDVVSIEISALASVGDTDGKLVLLASDVLSATLSISKTAVTSAIVNPNADGVGVLFISNNSDTKAIWYAVGLTPDPNNVADRRLLKAGRDASIAIKQNEKVAIVQAFS